LCLLLLYFVTTQNEASLLLFVFCLYYGFVVVCWFNRHLFIWQIFIE
jgi:hypothetical protein